MPRTLGETLYHCPACHHAYPLRLPACPACGAASDLPGARREREIEAVKAEIKRRLEEAL